jgi:hypothetical protein
VDLDPRHFSQFVSHLARGSGLLAVHKEQHQRCITQVIVRARLDGVRFQLKVVRPYYQEFGLHQLDITGRRGFAVEAVEAAQGHQRAVFHGVQTETILEQDGLHQLYQEQMEAFRQYYRGAVQSHIMPVLLRHYGLL